MEEQKGGRGGEGNFEQGAEPHGDGHGHAGSGEKGEIRRDAERTLGQEDEQEA
jgi:hypothetical protein